MIVPGCGLDPIHATGVVASDLAEAPGLAQAPGKPLDFSEVGCKEGQDGIRFPQLRLFNDDGFRLIVTRLGHILFYAVLGIPIHLGVLSM